MPKITNRASCTLSLVLAAVFFAGLIGCAVGIVPYVDAVCRDGHLEEAHKPVILVLGYGILVIAALADVFLFRLLRKVQKQEVFSEDSVILLRGISWCCVGAGCLFVLMGRFFLLSYGVAFVAVLVGICLRVVKNVIAEATAIKSENDLTV